MQPDVNQTFTSIPQTDIIAVSGKKRKNDIMKCHICHEQSFPDNQLQCFCSCKQKNGYAHPTCLQTYLENKINKSLEIDVDAQHATVCDRCQDSFKIHYNIIRKCSDFKKAKKAIDRKGFLFGICIIGIVLSIITLAVCSSILKRINYNEATSMPSDEKEIVICFIIFSALLLIFFAYKITEKFLTFRMAKVDI